MDRQRLHREGVPWDQRLRLAAPHAPAGEPDAAFLAEWQRSVDPFATGTFDRRLRLAGLSPDQAEAIMAVTDDDPEWLAVLDTAREVLRAAADGWGTNLVEVLERMEDEWPGLREIPFGHVFVPLAEWAGVPLEGHRARDACSPEAWEELQLWLVSRIARMLVRSMVDLVPPTGPANSRQAYAQSVHDLLGRGLEPLLERAPVAGRIIAMTVMQWREGVGELLDRLIDDGERLHEVFGAALPIRIESIALGAGDPHRGGRTASMVRLAGADTPVQIVYKPHDMRIEQAYVRIVNDFLAIPDDEQVACILAPTSEYGYASRILHRPAQSAEELRMFYERAGRQLVLMYILRVTDVHCENVIASGANLVMIDPETMLGPAIDLRDTHGPDRDLLTSSVHRLLALPRLHNDPDSGGAYDISGLGAQAHPPRAMRPWTDVNTDAMRFGGGTVVPQPPWHLPVAEGQVNPLPEHAQALLDGLERGYAQLLQPEWRAWLRERITACAGFGVRVVVRPTRTYVAVIGSALAPEALASARARAVGMEMLCRGLPVDDDLAAVILDAELGAVDAVDIPLLEYRLGSGVLASDRCTVEVACDGIEAALQRLDEMGERDLAWQSQIARISLELRWPGLMLADVPDASADPASTATELFVNAAADSSAIGPQGRRQWSAVNPVSMRHEASLGHAEIDGYAGLAGIVAALSAAVSDPTLTASQRDRADELLHDAWHSLAGAIDDAVCEGFAAIRYRGPGLAGFGGALRALTLPSASSTHARAFVDAFVTAFEPESWCVHHDVMRGAAGAIAPLITLSSSRRDAHAVDEVIDVLAESVVAGQWDDGGWYDPIAGRPLPGMRYGASGIALALVRAGVHRGRMEWIDAGARAFAWEDDLAEPVRVDLERTYLAPNGPDSWCAGAAGMALARAAAASVAAAHPGAAGWRATAREWVNARGQIEPITGFTGDQLCCGTLGVVACERLVAELLDDLEGIRRADERATAVVAARGGVRALRQACSPAQRLPGSTGFMGGLGGIATMLSGQAGDNVLRTWLT